MITMLETRLTKGAVTEGEFARIRDLFGSIRLGNLMEVRELYQQLLVEGGNSSKYASVMAGLSQASMLAAAACQGVVLGGFNAPLTTRLVAVNYHSVSKMFTNATSNGIFCAYEGEFAPSQKDGVERAGGRRSKVFHATTVGQELLGAFDFDTVGIDSQPPLS